VVVIKHFWVEDVWALVEARYFVFELDELLVELVVCFLYAVQSLSFCDFSFWSMSDRLCIVNTLPTAVMKKQIGVKNGNC